MISFQKIPPKNFDPKTGSIPGVATPSKPKDIGVPIPAFHSQLLGLINHGIPLDQAHAAIDNHPAITDKQTAKDIASAVYQIMGKPESTRQTPKE